MPDTKPSQSSAGRVLSLADIPQPMPRRPRVYLISDVLLYREGLSSSPVLQTQLEMVGAGGSGDFPDRISALRPDALLLDLGCRGSLAIPRRAQQILPDVRIVAFAVADVDDNVLACAEAGISSYVMQNGSSEDLVAAVRAALRGELVCSPRIAGLLFSRLATVCDGRPMASIDALLTPREREIAAMLARNLPNKEIARQLCLGPTTVKNHVHNILQKLNIHRRGDVARLQIDGHRWRVDTTNQAAERPHASDNVNPRSNSRRLASLASAQHGRHLPRADPDRRSGSKFDQVEH
jgi:two-component system, NarL family, nitrate/nitrite response regulator NarL